MSDLKGLFPPIEPPKRITRRVRQVDVSAIQERIRRDLEDGLDVRDEMPFTDEDFVSEADEHRYHDDLDRARDINKARNGQ